MLNKKVDTKVDLHCPEEQVWLKYGTSMDEDQDRHLQWLI